MKKNILIRMALAAIFFAWFGISVVVLLCGDSPGEELALLPFLLLKGAALGSACLCGRCYETTKQKGLI